MTGVEWFGFDVDVSEGEVNSVGCEGFLNTLIENDESVEFENTEVNVTLKSTKFTYTRQDVLEKLNYYAGAAAAFNGPHSDAVNTIEDDIDAVRNGCSLLDFAFLFGIEVPEDSE